MVVDLAGARLTLAAAEGAVAWVEKVAAVRGPAVAEVRKLAVVVVVVVVVVVAAAVVVAAEEDDDGKKPSIEENQ